MSTRCSCLEIPDSGREGDRPWRTSCLSQSLRLSETECFLHFPPVDFFLIFLDYILEAPNRHVIDQSNISSVLAFILNINVASEEIPISCLCFQILLEMYNFSASFEALNIPITYELFCNSPKKEWLRVWKNHSHEPMVCTPRYLRCGALSSQMLPAHPQIPERRIQRNPWFLNRFAALRAFLFSLLQVT